MEVSAYEAILADIISNRTVLVSNDVRWDVNESRFTGSFLWNGISTSNNNLLTFASWAESIKEINFEKISQIVAISSSGISWGAALSIATKKDLHILRLYPHKYGPFNPNLKKIAGQEVLLVDNFIGSGDTVFKASELLNESGINISNVLVVESNFDNDGTSKINLHSIINTKRKLLDLLKRGYFNKTETLIVSKILENPDDYLNDAGWVEKIQNILNGIL